MAIQMVLLLLVIMVSSVIFFSPYDPALLSRNSRRLHKSYSLGQLLTMSMIGCFLSVWTGTFYLNRSNYLGEDQSNVLLMFVLCYHIIFSVTGIARNVYLIRAENLTRRSDLKDIQRSKELVIMTQNPLLLTKTPGSGRRDKTKRTKQYSAQI